MSSIRIQGKTAYVSYQNQNGQPYAASLGTQARSLSALVMSNKEGVAFNPLVLGLSNWVALGNTINGGSFFSFRPQDIAHCAFGLADYDFSRTSTTPNVQFDVTASGQRFMSGLFDAPDDKPVTAQASFEEIAAYDQQLAEAIRCPVNPTSWQLTYQGRAFNGETTTFKYSISIADDSTVDTNLQFLVLEICPRLYNSITATQPKSTSVTRDNKTGIVGIRWTNDGTGKQKQFSVTFSGDIKEDRVDYAVRGTKTAFVGCTKGPGCPDQVPRPLEFHAKGNGQVVLSASMKFVPASLNLYPLYRGIYVERAIRRVNGGQDVGSPLQLVEIGSIVRVTLQVTTPDDLPSVILEDWLPAGLEPLLLNSNQADAAGQMTTEQPPQPLGTPAELPTESDVSEGPRLGIGKIAAPLQDMTTVSTRPSYYYSQSFTSPDVQPDKIMWFASYLRAGVHTVSYYAIAVTPGVYTQPPAQCKSIIEPEVMGLSAAGSFLVSETYIPPDQVTSYITSKGSSTNPSMQSPKACAAACAAYQTCDLRVGECVDVFIDSGVFRELDLKPKLQAASASKIHPSSLLLLTAFLWLPVLLHDLVPQLW
jgi:hypothetical protein